MNRALLGISAAALTVSVAACGGETKDDPTISAPSASSSSSASAAATPSASASATDEGVILRAGDFSFAPRTVTIKAKEVLSIRNSGRTAHTVTAKPGQQVSFDIALDEPGGRATFSTSIPGSYEFVCTIHESRGMTGTLVVTA